MGFGSHNLFGAFEKASGGLSSSSNTDLSHGSPEMSPEAFVLCPGLSVTLNYSGPRSATFGAERDWEVFKTTWGLGSRETGLALSDPYIKNIR